MFVSVCVRECICVYNDHAERQFLLHTRVAAWFGMKHTYVHVICTCTYISIYV